MLRGSKECSARRRWVFTLVLQAWQQASAVHGEEGGAEAAATAASAGAKAAASSGTGGEQSSAEAALYDAIWKEIEDYKFRALQTVFIG